MAVRALPQVLSNLLTNFLSEYTEILALTRAAFKVHILHHLVLSLSRYLRASVQFSLTLPQHLLENCLDLEAARVPHNKSTPAPLLSIISVVEGGLRCASMWVIVRVQEP
jgi:hypothetical protein